MKRSGVGIGVPGAASWIAAKLLEEGRGGGGGISIVATAGDIITSNMNSVRYYQLMELLTLALSPTWLIPSSGGR